MIIYVLQYRRSGDDYSVQLFHKADEAERFALNFLYDLFYNYEPATILPNVQLETLEAFCADNDLGYIELGTHIL